MIWRAKRDEPVVLRMVECFEWQGKLQVDMKVPPAVHAPRDREERKNKWRPSQVSGLKFLVIVDDQLSAFDFDMALADERMNHPGDCLPGSSGHIG